MTAEQRQNIVCLQLATEADNLSIGLTFEVGLHLMCLHQLCITLFLEALPQI